MVVDAEWRLDARAALQGRLANPAYNGMRPSVYAAEVANITDALAREVQKRQTPSLMWMCPCESIWDFSEKCPGCGTTFETSEKVSDKNLARAGCNHGPNVKCARCNIKCVGCGLPYGHKYPQEPSVRVRIDGQVRCHDCESQRSLNEVSNLTATIQMLKADLKMREDELLILKQASASRSDDVTSAIRSYARRVGIKDTESNIPNGEPRVLGREMALEIESLREQLHSDEVSMQQAVSRQTLENARDAVHIVLADFAHRGLAKESAGARACKEALVNLLDATPAPKA